MSRVNLVILVLSLTVAFVRPAVAGESAAFSIGDPIGAIERDFQSGNLTLDEKAILQITAIKKPEELPSEYRIFDLVTGKSGLRSATPAILAIMNSWDQLLPSTQALISSYLIRPSTEFTFDSPSGFFVLHYDTLGDDAVPLADTDISGVPDFVERCASYCDSSLSRHLEFGYRTPPSDTGLGGDEKFDVYFENMAYYGYAMPEDPGPEEWNDYYSYLVLNSDFIGFPPNNDPEGSVAGAAKATVAHEFHHCVQFAYDSGELLWFMELDAVYMEDIVFDHVDDNYNYLLTFFNYPEKSLMESSLHMYSSFVWGLYLAQRFDTSLMVSIWEGARYGDIFDVLSDTLLQNYGWTQDSAFAEFTCWNYITSYHDDGLHHEEAVSYPLIAVSDTHSVYPTFPQFSPRNPAGYGACYVRFRPGLSEGNLRVFFDGSDGRQWSAYVIKSLTDSQHELEKFVLTTGTYEGIIEIPDFHAYESVTLVGANLSEFLGGESYIYSAEMFGDYAVASVILTIDTSVYSGAPRNFEYQVYNTSPLDDVYSIIVWDDAGWIVPDTTDRFIASGDSVVVQVPVHSPVSMPLGESSILHFKAVSRNDTNVYDEQSATAVTVLQRGDANFDGLIDIGDVTYLIAYLFISGDEPVPIIESGNYDCDNGVDISDLTSIIRFLFIDGSPSPCNPF